MALMLQEYTGAQFKETNAAAPLDLTEADISYTDAIDPNSLMVEIEGIHAYPHATRNFTRYMPKALKESIPSWTKPYMRPLIKHHNESNGEIIGRVCDAEYKTNKTLSGTPALKFTVNIPGTQTKEDVQNGLLATASIGVMAHDVRCSICGAHLENGETCNHERGQVYTVNKKPQTCYWDIYGFEAKELSYVVVPSDMYARNIKIYPASQSGSKTQLKESTDLQDPINNTDDNNIDLNEHKGDVDDSMDAAKEKELKEALEKNTALEKQVKELTEAKEKADKSVKELTESKDKLDAQVKELSEAKQQLEEEKAQEVKLREGAENALAEAKKTIRESMVETFQLMRKAVGREALSEDAISKRSEDSIRDGIADLKEEFTAIEANKTKLPKPNSVKNPSLVEGHDSDVFKPKSTHISEPVNLREGAESILNNIFRAHVR